jgi:hypothetical protein
MKTRITFGPMLALALTLIGGLRSLPQRTRPAARQAQVASSLPTLARPTNYRSRN